MRQKPSIAVVYLARGFDFDWQNRARAFIASYRAFPAGWPHTLHVIVKGFRSAVDALCERALFGAFDCRFIECDDDAFDIGAYREACAEIVEDRVFFLNTNSEIAGENWLAKYAVNWRNGVGLAGATGSFEALTIEGEIRAPFPNPHLRSNAFLIDRAIFLEIVSDRSMATKVDLYELEAGVRSLTREVCRRGSDVVVIGRDGRAYAMPMWPLSRTFRQGDQGNLLVHDNQTAFFAASTWTTKRLLAGNAWGKYLDPLLAGILPMGNRADAEPRHPASLKGNEARGSTA